MYIINMTHDMSNMLLYEHNSSITINNILLFEILFLDKQCLKFKTASSLLLTVIVIVCFPEAT